MELTLGDVRICTDSRCHCSHEIHRAHFGFANNSVRAIVRHHAAAVADLAAWAALEVQR